eukprot:244846_1
MALATNDSCRTLWQATSYRTIANEYEICGMTINDNDEWIGLVHTIQVYVILALVAMQMLTIHKINHIIHTTCLAITLSNTVDTPSSISTKFLGHFAWIAKCIMYREKLDNVVHGLNEISVGIVCFVNDAVLVMHAAMESETSMVHDPNMKCLSVFRGKIWCKKYYSKHRKGFEDSMWNRRIKPVKCTPRTCCSECSTSEGVSSEFIIG